MNITSVSTKHRLQTAADHCLHHANENMTTIVPLFSNTENNGLQSVCSLHLVLSKYRKILKISPGAYIFQRPFLRGLCMEGHFRLKIDWASLIPGRKFTIFLCCTLYLMAISKYKPSAGGGGEGPIFGGAI